MRCAYMQIAVHRSCRDVEGLRSEDSSGRKGVRPHRAPRLVSHSITGGVYLPVYTRTPTDTCMYASGIIRTNRVRAPPGRDLHTRVSLQGRPRYRDASTPGTCCAFKNAPLTAIVQARTIITLPSECAPASTQFSSLSPHPHLSRLDANARPHSFPGTAFVCERLFPADCTLILLSLGDAPQAPAPTPPTLTRHPGSRPTPSSSPG